MATLDTTAITYQLKQVYGQGITDLFASHNMTYNLFNTSSRKAAIRPAGVGYYFSTRQGDVEGTGGRAQGALLPEPLIGEGIQGTIVPKQLYSVIRVSGLMLEAGKGDVAAFVDSQGDAVMGAYRSLTTDMNRQCHGDGYGALATLSAASEALSTTTTWEVTCDNDVGVRYLRKGMVVDFYDGNSIDVSSVASRISSINPVTRVVTMEDHGETAASGSGTYQAYHPIVLARAYTIVEEAVPSGAVMVRYGARVAAHTTSAASYEIMGLAGMYDDDNLLGTFEGIDTGNDPEFRATVMGNSDVNRELSIDLMLSAMDMTAAKSGSGKTVGIIRMGLGQRRKYFGLLAPDIRFTPGELVGGYERLKFTQNAAVEMIIDPVTQPNRIYFEPSDVIKKYELTGIDWGGKDNKMHWREDYDEFTMFLKTYTNLGVEERQSLTLLEDLTEPDNSPF